jgi:Uma2 family endonuclease
VWLIEPKPREVNVCHPGSKTPQVLSTEDTLEGENILPGFKVEVAKLFAG